MPKRKTKKNKKETQDEKDLKVLNHFAKANGFDEAEKALGKTYKATLKVLGHTYKSQGNTPEEVLNGFKTPNWIKGAGVLSIEKNGIIKEKIIAGNHITHIFGMASGTMREISLKWVKQLFV